MRWHLIQLSTLLLAAGLLAVAASRGAPSDARVRIDGLRLEGGQVLVSFGLEDAFGAELERRLESGLPTGFTYGFQLVRPRSWWFDNTLASSQLQVDAMYNAVTREYLINYRHDGNLIESRVAREPAELPEAMTEFEDFPAFALEGLGGRQRLYLRLRAELGRRTVMFFIPGTLHTDWAATRRFTLDGR